MSDKMGVTKLNEVILNSIPNSWSNQEYVQGFDCGSILFKISPNMFDHMELSKGIYEGVVLPSYKKCSGRSQT